MQYRVHITKAGFKLTLVMISTDCIFVNPTTIQSRPRLSLFVMKFHSFCQILHFQDVTCEDETLQQVLQTAVSKLFLALTPLKANTQFL
jgi:hypothetical protein